MPYYIFVLATSIVDLGKTADIESPAIFSDPLYSAAYNNAFSKSAGGVQLGVGVETGTWHNISVRTEFDWSKYQNITNLNAGSPDPLDGGTIFVVQTRD